MSDRPNTVTIKTIKHVAIPMTPGNEQAHTISEALDYCNRTIGYLNGLADDMERLSKGKADRCREFAEQLDIRRVKAVRALVQLQAEQCQYQDADLQYCKWRDRVVPKLADSRDGLLAACEKMADAMERYQMDVEESPPFVHREMMREARVAIAKAKKVHGAD